MLAAAKRLRSPVSSHVLQLRTYVSARPEPPKSDFRAALQQLSLLARFGAAAYAIQVYVASTTMSVGPSMQPTFNPAGDLLFTEYLTPRLKRLQAGDVVVATKPTDARVSILKRVRGMPGEKIFVQQTRNSPPEWITVPDGHVWLEGDNPRQSSDSRDYGPVPICLIRGKVWARFWPLSQACWVESRVIDHSKAREERVGGPARGVVGLSVVLETRGTEHKTVAEANSGDTCDCSAGPQACNKEDASGSAPSKDKAGTSEGGNATGR